MEKLKATMFAFLMPVLSGVAAMVSEKVSDGSLLDPSVVDGAKVYADETEGSMTFRVSLSEFGASEGLLYIGESEPIAVRHGMEVEVLCAFDSFKVVSIRLVAGGIERSSGIAVYRSRSDGVLIHEKATKPTFLDSRGASPRSMDRRDGFVRFSSRWNSGEWIKVVAYRAGEYGKAEAQGIVLLDRSGTGEGIMPLEDVRDRLQPGNYVFVHSDGVSHMVASVIIKIEGFIIICK